MPTKKRMVSWTIMDRQKQTFAIIESLLQLITSKVKNSFKTTKKKSDLNKNFDDFSLTQKSEFGCKGSDFESGSSDELS